MIERQRTIINGKETYVCPFKTIRSSIPQKMTPEMWGVYRTIEKNTLENKTTSVVEICNNVPFYVVHTSKSNKSNCPQLYEDIMLINTLYRGEHDKYIITNSNHFKLASKNEIIRELTKIKGKFSKYQWIYQAIIELCSLDGQCKLIDESSKAKEYKESFV